MSRLFDALTEVVPAPQIGPWFDNPNPTFEGSAPLQVIERGESDRLWRTIWPAVNCPGNNDGTGTLTVWDNNYANQSRELALDFRGDELQVGNSNRPLKGIFLEKYSSHQPPDNPRLC